MNDFLTLLSNSNCVEIPTQHIHVYILPLMITSHVSLTSNYNCKIADTVGGRNHWWWL
ncbi:hypothetical protein NC651_007082 [Populus alba x Populus x berolinensis]|nr:hypothetical protein NC651_007082 [Populus alba x Populus x berolinensis]